MNVKGLLKKVAVLENSITVLEGKFKALLPQLLAVRAELEDALAAASAVGNASEVPTKTAPVRKERPAKVRTPRAEKPVRVPKGTKVTKVVKAGKVAKVGKAKAKKVAGLKPTPTDLKRKANKVIAAKAGARVKAKRKSKKK